MTDSRKEQLDMSNPFAPPTPWSRGAPVPDRYESRRADEGIGPYWLVWDTKHGKPVDASWGPTYPGGAQAGAGIAAQVLNAQERSIASAVSGFFEGYSDPEPPDLLSPESINRIEWLGRGPCRWGGLMYREGSWTVHSESDPRWNARGRGLVGLGCTPDADEHIERMRAQLGEPPADLRKGFWKD